MMVCMEHSAVDVSDAFRADIANAPTPGATVAAVLAVKSLDRAKSRLAATFPDHLDPDHPEDATSATEPRSGDPRGTRRGSLVLAMFLDTVTALREAGISRIVVVSPDEEVLDVARRSGTAGVAEESPAAMRGVPGGSGVGTRGLNAAFGHGARWAREAWPESTRLLFVQADLPAATGVSVAEMLREAERHQLCFVTDRDGTGTVLLSCALLEGTPGLADAPRFGPGSAEAHRAAGAVELDPARRRWPDLRTDVDTASDLEAARRLGFGRHTTETLHRT